ncbi:MAG: AraC-type DNA-binding protein [Oscillospiraceae bacterium]|jgi:AraC-like DNA-binding protein|nr:AraC-type DNA-binding protein [Oscillospiraceae bacterium]
MDSSSFKHSYKNTLRENLSLAVYNTGYQKCDRGVSWGPAIRDHFLIHYIDSGKGTYECGGKIYEINKGDLFLVYPSQIVTYTADLQEPWEYFWVGFNGTEAKRLMALTSFSAESPVLHYKDDSILRNILLKIYRHRGSQPINDCRMVGTLYLFLGELIHFCNQSDGGGHKPNTNNYMEKALKYIQYNYSRYIGVQDVAEYVGISRSHLYRLFVETTGLSPNEFLSMYKINEACSLLRKGTLSVNQVASSVGFSDALYFSRVFKKIKGVPPTKYIKT